MTDKPTVGRIVHYYCHNFAAGDHNGMGVGPYAAIVSQAHVGSPYVNLKVLIPFGEILDIGSVREKPAEVGPSDDSYWAWPPRG